MSINHLLTPNVGQSFNPLDITVNEILSNTLEVIGPIDTETGYSIDGKLILSADGTRNAFSGFHTNHTSTTSADNACFGDSAGASISVGTYNVLVGSASGYDITSASGNTCVGYESGRILTTEIENTFLGSLSGSKCAGGNNNVYIGYNALGGTGSGNIALGSNILSGTGNTIGNDNVIIGYNSCTSSGITGLTNNIFIGSGNNPAASTTTTNSLIIGNSQTSLGSNTSLIDPALLSSVTTPDATNGTILCHNLASGELTSTRNLTFPYTTLPPAYSGTLSATVIADAGTFNGRVGVLTITRAAELGGGQSVTFTVANSFAAGTKLVMASLVGLVSNTPYITLIGATAESGNLSFVFINLGVGSTNANWSVNVAFYILN